MQLTGKIFFLVNYICSWRLGKDYLHRQRPYSTQWRLLPILRYVCAACWKNRLTEGRIMSWWLLDVELSSFREPCRNYLECPCFRLFRQSKRVAAWWIGWLLMWVAAVEWRCGRQYMCLKWNAAVSPCFRWHSLVSCPSAVVVSVILNIVVIFIGHVFVLMSLAPSWL